MSPQHWQHYWTLKQALEQLEQDLAQAAPSSELKANFLQTQRFFQQQVVPLSEPLAPAIASRLRSYQTEIHRQLRLVGTDFIFLGTARQTGTIEQRRAQIRDRLQVLISYCDTLLQSFKSTDSRSP